MPYKLGRKRRRKVSSQLGPICALTRQNLLLGFLIKRDSNQSPQLQRLARKLKLVASLDNGTFQ